MSFSGLQVCVQQDTTSSRCSQSLLVCISYIHLCLHVISVVCVCVCAKNVSKMTYSQTRLSRYHTHTPSFNGPLSGTTQMSQYQKGKTNLDFTEARDSEWQWHQLGHMQICTSLQTNNHASTLPLSFLQAGCPSCRPTHSVKALKAPGPNYEYSIGQSIHLSMFYTLCVRMGPDKRYPFKTVIHLSSIP